MAQEDEVMRTLLTRKASVQLEAPRGAFKREDPDEDLLGEREEENVFQSALNQVPQLMHRVTSEYAHYDYFPHPQHLHYTETSARRLSLEEPPVDKSFLANNKKKEFQKRLLFEILARDVKL